MPLPSLPTVYLETSVISYLASSPSRDLIRAARQQTTHRLWSQRRGNYYFVTSWLVEMEAAAGNPEEAAKRLEIVGQMEFLKVSPEAQQFALVIMQSCNLPPKALNDAGHVAIAAANGVEYLATWNLRHLANVAMRRTIELTCRKNGYLTPLICTPDQLVTNEEENDDLAS